MDTLSTCCFTTWREADLLAACVSPQRGCAAAIAEKLMSAALADGVSAVRLFSLARVSSNQALLSGQAGWVLAGPAVWVQAGPAVRRLSGPAVGAPNGPAVWEVAGGLDMVLATTFSLPGMCRMYDRWRPCRGVQVSVALAKANVMVLWSVSMENSRPSSMCLKCRMPAVQASNSLSKAEYRSCVGFNFC